MKAESNTTPQIAYAQYDWGDWIEATKWQLQEMSIGVGLAFPGELGGPKRVLNTADLRGFPCEVQVSGTGDGRFKAYVRFPGRPSMPAPQPQPFAPGVTKTEQICGDVYVGAASALVAAGLVEAHQFPGCPGMRKVRVSIFADGTMPTGAPTVRHRDLAREGAKLITKSGRNFCVTIRIAKATSEARWSEERKLDDAWRECVRAMPRPLRLDHPRAAHSTARGHLRLVWSAAA